VAGRPVGNVAQLLSAVAALKPGETSDLAITRRDGDQSLSITPGRRPSTIQPPR